MSLRIQGNLQSLLKKLVSKNEYEGEDVTIHFRDPNYSHETGGFHPVEIMRRADGSICYITDFSYSRYGELEKELDFDFELGYFQQFGVDYPLHAGKELFQIWQKNFLAYYKMEVFVVEVRPL